MTRMQISRADVAVVAIALLFGQQEAWAPLGPGFSNRVGPPSILAVTYLVAAAALLWRRSAPLVVVTVISVALAIYYVLFGAPNGLGNVLPSVFALYALGRHGASRDLWPGMALTAATLLVHQWRDPLPPLPAGPSLVFWSTVLGSGVLGWILRVRAEDLRQLTRRAGLLEIEREQRAREAVVAERARIARELHDLVGHGISLIVLQVVRAQETLDRSEGHATREQLERLETTARDTLAEMRRLLMVVGEGDAPLAPQPGIADIKTLVDQIRSEGVPIDLHIIDGATDVPSGIGLAAYRLVQEGLTNVLKHGGRIREASVVVARTGDTLSVEVVDRGGRSSTEFREGRGLMGMRERVALYGGSLEIGPRSEGGFGVLARLPIGAAE